MPHEVVEYARHLTLKTIPGRDTLEAIVSGLEVHSRTADINGVPMGLHCVGAALGTVAVAARVMGLSEEETKNAMGMVLSTASVAELNMGAADTASRTRRRARLSA